MGRAAIAATARPRTGSHTASGSADIIASEGQDARTAGIAVLTQEGVAELYEVGRGTAAVIVGSVPCRCDNPHAAFWPQHHVWRGPGPLPAWRPRQRPLDRRHLPGDSRGRQGTDRHVPLPGVVERLRLAQGVGHDLQLGGRIPCGSEIVKQEPYQDYRKKDPPFQTYSDIFHSPHVTRPSQIPAEAYMLDQLQSATISARHLKRTPEEALAQAQQLVVAQLQTRHAQH